MKIKIPSNIKIFELNTLVQTQQNGHYHRTKNLKKNLIL